MVKCIINYKDDKGKFNKNDLSKVNGEVKNGEPVSAYATLKKGMISVLNLETGEKEPKEPTWNGELLTFVGVTKNWENICKDIRKGVVPRVLELQLHKALEEKEKQEMKIKENKKEFLGRSGLGTEVKIPKGKEAIPVDSNVADDKPDVVKSTSEDSAEHENVDSALETAGVETTAPVADEVQEEANEVSEESNESTDSKCEKDYKLANYGENSTHVELAQRDGFILNMAVNSNPNSMKCEGCKFYISRVGSKIPLLTNESEITIKRKRILKSTDHAVMNVIDDFDIGFTEDDKKKAFDRAKEFLNISKKRIESFGSLPIGEAYMEMVAYATQEAEIEMKNTLLTEEDRKFKYDKKNGTIAIKAVHMQKVLEVIDSGYTKTMFCKKLTVLETHIGKQLIISNRSRKGYGYNDNNIRYYKFNIIDIYADNNDTEVA